MRRVRVISEPITDYIRWEHTSTALNLKIGEEIRWLPRHLLPGEIVFPVAGHDWWLFDDRLVAVGHFREDGRVQGHEIITDPAVVADCIQAVPTPQKPRFGSEWRSGGGLELRFGSE